MVIRMCYTNNKLIVRPILDPILKRLEQHPKQTAPLCGYLCFSTGNTIFLLPGLPQSCSSFVCRACLPVGGRSRGGRVECVGAGYRTWIYCCSNKGTWRVSSRKPVELGVAALHFLCSASFSGILASQHHMSSLSGLQLNFPTDSQCKSALVVS